MKRINLSHIIIYFLLLVIFIAVIGNFFYGTIDGLITISHMLVPKTGTIEYLLAEDPVFNGFNLDNISRVTLSLPSPDNPQETIDLQTESKENITAIFDYLSSPELKEVTYRNVYIPSSGGRLYFSDKNNTYTQEIQYILNIDNESGVYFSLTRSHRTGYATSYEKKIFKAAQKILFEDIIYLLQ